MAIEKRYFECKKDGHNKFWEITIENTTTNTAMWAMVFIFTTYGKIGSVGTVSARKQVTRTALASLIQEKINKGYKEIRKDVVTLKEATPKKVNNNFIVDIYED